MSDMIPAWKDEVLQPVDKLAAHVEGLRHKAVSIFVMQGDELLIQRRALGKYHTPGLWANTCCTHPGWGETPEDCAVRRMDEELGLTGLDLMWRDQIEYRANVGGGMIEHEVVDMFVAAPDVRPVAAPNPDEVMEVRWVSLEALREEVAATPERFTPWLRIYLDQHLDRVLAAE